MTVVYFCIHLFIYRETLSLHVVRRNYKKKRIVNFFYAATITKNLFFSHLHAFKKQTI